MRDTGPGVPEAARERIFEEFGHADPADAVRYGGAGLGLAVVKRLVEAMDGQLLLDCTAGRGLRLRLRGDVRGHRRAPRCPSRSSGVRVALLTPSDEVRESTARQIEACGGEVLAPATLDEAAAAPTATPSSCSIRARRPTQVPHQAARAARRVVLLKPEERDLIARYRTAGWSGYLIKPLRRVSLAARVEAVHGVDAPGGPAVPQPRTSACPRPRCRACACCWPRTIRSTPLLAKSLLRREGCTVELAGTGEEALRCAGQRSRYDLVLMDVRMPGLDGPAAARALRARGDETPVIALTANAFEEDRRACLDAGMNDFLAKPVDPAALRAALARWTNRDAPRQAGLSKFRAASRRPSPGGQMTAAAAAASRTAATAPKRSEASASRAWP